MTAYVLPSGGVTTSSGTVLSTGDSLTVTAGGSAIFTTVAAGGLQSVYNGGTAFNTQISSGGTEVVYAGGVTSDSLVSGGGQEIISSGAVANDAFLQGSTASVLTGGTALNTEVDEGNLAIAPGAVLDNATVEGVGVPGTITLAAAAVVSGAVTFGPDAALAIDGSNSGLIGNATSAPTAVISAFQPDDDIYLPWLPYSSAEDVSFNGTQLTIVGLGTEETLDLLGALPSSISVEPYNSGTVIESSPYDSRQGGINIPPLSFGVGVPGPSDANTTVTGAFGATTLAAAPATIIARTSGDLTVSGGVSPFAFVGGAGGATVTGGAGNATLFGSTGDAESLLTGGSGSNILVAGSGAGASTLIGGSGTTTEFGKGSGPVEFVAGANGNTTMAGQFGTGIETFFTAPATTAIMALDEAADTVVGGTGNSTVLGGAGPDVYGFLDGHAGGTEAIEGIKANDVLVFGGYTSYPIASEGLANGSDTITLTDGTVITLVGFDHKVF